MKKIVSLYNKAVKKPNIIINVVDATALERNLYFTFQLLELEAPIIISLNQVDLASKKGLKIDVEKLSEALGVQVISTVAVTGSGVNELLTKAVEVITEEKQRPQIQIRYGKEIEKKAETIERVLCDKLKQLCNVYPARWIALKLLERDSDVAGKLKNYVNGKEILDLSDKLANELEKLHGEPSSVIIASERYSLASKISKAV